MNTHQQAVTGDGVSDLMAGIRKVCDESGLSARQVQYVFECYVKLYKDAADAHDKDAAVWPRLQWLQSGTHSPSTTLPDSV